MAAVNNLTEKPMGSVKKYLPVIIIVVPLIIAVILRSTGTGHFRYDAAKWAEPSISGENIITPGRLSQLKGDIMIINLGSDQLNLSVYPKQTAVSADSVMTKKFMKTISSNNGPVVLCSDDPAVSARIWMLLSQTGIRDLYIFSPDSLNETIKEKFRTDTVISPE